MPGQGAARWPQCPPHPPGGSRRSSVQLAGARLPVSPAGAPPLGWFPVQVGRRGAVRTPRSAPVRPQHCAELPDNYSCPLLTSDSHREGAVHSLVRGGGGPIRGRCPAVSQMRGGSAGGAGFWLCPHLVISQGDAGGIRLLRGAIFCLGQGRLDPRPLKLALSCPCSRSCHTRFLLEGRTPRQQLGLMLLLPGSGVGSGCVSREASPSLTSLHGPEPGQGPCASSSVWEGASLTLCRDRSPEWGVGGRGPQGTLAG